MNLVEAAVNGIETGEFDLERAEKFAKNILEGFDKRQVPPDDQVAAAMIVAVVRLLEADLGPADVYTTIVELTGAVLEGVEEEGE